VADARVIPLAPSRAYFRCHFRRGMMSMTLPALGSSLGTHLPLPTGRVLAFSLSKFGLCVFSLVPIACDRFHPIGDSTQAFVIGLTVCRTYTLRGFPSFQKWLELQISPILRETVFDLVIVQRHFSPLPAPTWQLCPLHTGQCWDFLPEAIPLPFA